MALSEEWTFIIKAGRFVNAEWMQRQDRADFNFFQMKPMKLIDFMDYVGISSGGALAEEDVDCYVEFMKCAFPDIMEGRYNVRGMVLLNGKREFLYDWRLLDHHNEVCLAAFHNDRETKFLHPRLQDLMELEPISSVHYEQCAYAIVNQTRLSFPKHETFERAKIVFSALTRDETVPRATLAGIDVLAKTKFVPARPVNSDLPIRTKIPSSGLISLSEGMLSRYFEACWSQLPVFLDDPCSSISGSIDGHCRPAPGAVIRHLVFLSENRHRILESEIPSFISSANACYQFLQYCEENFTAPHDEAIWFNADEKNFGMEEFVAAWVTGKSLCLGLPQDSPDRIRESLEDFTFLLKKCNIRRIEQNPSGSPSSAGAWQPLIKRTTTIIGGVETAEAGVQTEHNIAVRDRKSVV